MIPLWTQDDVDKTKAAVVALSTGQSVQSVTYAGPPARTVVYQLQDLDKLKAMLAQMVAGVRDAAGTRRGYSVSTHRKGT